MRCTTIPQRSSLSRWGQHSSPRGYCRALAPTMGCTRCLGQVAIGRVPANLSGRGKIRDRVVFTLQIVETTVPGQALTLRSNLLGGALDGGHHRGRGAR